MQISQFKTETDFATAANPPEGYYLRWVKQNADGTATEYIKDHTGAVQVLTGGGSGGGELPEIDDVPTENSDNLITSGGVYAALGDIENALDAIINGGA